MEFGGLLCEEDVWGGEGEEEMVDGEGFFKVSGSLSVVGGCDAGGCDCGVSVGFPSLVFLVPKNKMLILSKMLHCFFVHIDHDINKHDKN